VFSLTAILNRPILGGILSSPETQWPESLGRILYLQSHPYFLPCLIAAIFSFAVYLVTLITLKEVGFFMPFFALFYIYMTHSPDFRHRLLSSHTEN